MRDIKRKVFLTNILFILFAINSTYSETIINDGSEIAGTWNLSGSPYLIMGEATILEDSELIIEAGVEVKLAVGTDFDYSSGNFDAGFLRVNGKISANGTDENQIIFTRNSTSGNWSIIYFSETADVSSVLKNCMIEYGNEISNLVGGSTGFWGAISFNNISATIINSSIENSSSSGIYCYNNSYPFIQNNEIRNSGVAAILTDFSYPQVIENLIDNNSYGIYCTNNSIFEIQYNQILNSTNDGINCDTSAPIISNNKITGNNFGITLYESSPDIIGNLISQNNTDGINCFTNSSPDITNNTIVNNQEYGIFVYNIASPVITNTIFFGNYETNDLIISGYDDDTSYPIIKYSSLQMLENDLQANVQIQTGNIYNQEPLFVNQGDDPFSLTENSPCIDTGTPNTIGLNLPDDDIIYNPRITNNNVDMGAYEYTNVGIETDEYELEITNYELKQNYPNPFNPYTRINYEFTSTSFSNLRSAEIVVYNTLGQSVWSSGNLLFTINHSSLLFDGSKFNSGIYYYSLFVDGKKISSKSMLLVK